MANSATTSTVPVSRIPEYSDAVHALYDFYKNTISKKKYKSWKYIGPDTTSVRLTVCNSSVKKMLTKEHFEYAMEEHHEDPIHILLSATYLLGIQYGIILCSEKPDDYIEHDGIIELINDAKRKEKYEEIMKNIHIDDSAIDDELRAMYNERKNSMK